MMKEISSEINYPSHGCFSIEPSIYFNSPGRIHIPIAEKCSLGCLFCGYSNDGNISRQSRRPGVSTSIFTSEEMINDYLVKSFIRYPDIKIVGVSGPGDPLANGETLKTLIYLLENKFSDKILCLCSSGNEFLDCEDILLHSSSLQYVTFTINTLEAEKAARLYRLYSQSPEKATRLIDQQIYGVKKLIDHHISIKINCIYIPEINESEIPGMFEFFKKIGVTCFNLMPLVKMEYSVFTANSPNNMNYQYQFSLMKDKLYSMGFPLTFKCCQCKADDCGKLIWT